MRGKKKRKLVPLPLPRPAKAARKVLGGFALDNERVFDRAAAQVRKYTISQRKRFLKDK